VRLTREVHHRVKNNLQVVASLIALHARGSTGDVAAAYASIQRRVDALAVVHRNHYAELEENRGVALRSLIGELTSNLRATAPAEASHFHIMLDMAVAHVSQDVAVPVAFLITEMVELLMTAVPASP
jgi:two-component sensor histidine kinase